MKMTENLLQSFENPVWFSTFVIDKEGHYSSTTASSCKEIFVKISCDHLGNRFDFYFSAYSLTHLNNFINNINVVHRELGLPKPKLITKDRKVYVVSQFWKRDCVRTDLLACIFRGSEFKKIDSIDDFINTSIYFNKNTIAALKKAKTISDILRQNHPLAFLRAMLFSTTNGLISFLNKIERYNQELFKKVIE